MITQLYDNEGAPMANDGNGDGGGSHKKDRPRLPTSGGDDGTDQTESRSVFVTNNDKLNRWIFQAARDPEVESSALAIMIALSAMADPVTWRVPDVKAGVVEHSTLSRKTVDRWMDDVLASDYFEPAGDMLYIGSDGRRLWRPAYRMVLKEDQQPVDDDDETSVT